MIEGASDGVATFKPTSEVLKHHAKTLAKSCDELQSKLSGHYKERENLNDLIAREEKSLEALRKSCDHAVEAERAYTPELPTTLSGLSGLPYKS